MKKKYIKLNDNYSHLSLGNIISAIKDESKNKSSAIQSEVFSSIFDIDYANESTINNYCIGSRSIGNDYKQTYINLKKRYQKDSSAFISIINNLLTIMNGSIFSNTNITDINKEDSLRNVCIKLYNIAKNDFYVRKEYIDRYRTLLNKKEYYNLFIEFLLFAILEKKQPLFEDEQTKNVVETILQNSDISVIDLQNFLLLELKEGINFSYSLRNLAENGNPYANYKLAVMEFRGEYVGFPRYDKAFEYFKKAAENNHPSAYWMMGNIIIKNRIGIPKESDYKKAFEYFKKAEELGNIAAINSIGLCYKNGLGVKKDINKAIDYFKKAASKNYAYAMNNLGICEEEKKQYDKAYNYFLKSAQMKESFACNRIGEYERRKNNKTKALYYYKQALESSYKETTPWAYYNIAKYYYLNGDLETNTIQDTDKAISYFEYSQELIESLLELLFIYYKRKDLARVNHYLKLIEEHPKYNSHIKRLIEIKLKK